MKTSRLSTVNYYTPDYLVERLKELCSKNPTLVCYFVHHLPEGNGDKKEHNHLLFVDDCSPVDSNCIYAYFRTKLENGETTTRATPRFEKTKDVNDWFAYAVHDKVYLAKKGKPRERHYRFSDIIVVTADGVSNLAEYAPAAVSECCQFIKRIVVRDDSVLHDLVQMYSSLGVPFAVFYKEIRPSLAKTRSLHDAYRLYSNAAAILAERGELDEARRALGLDA